MDKETDFEKLCDLSKTTWLLVGGTATQNLGSLSQSHNLNQKTLYIASILFYKNKASLLYKSFYINLQKSNQILKSSTSRYYTG